MNSLEAYSLESPFEKIDECARFIIDDITTDFILSDILTIGQEYTLSLWIKSDSESSITVADTEIQVSNSWNKNTVTFDATRKNLSIEFGNIGTYYVYQPQLEIGNKATDWTPATEDMASSNDIDLVSQELYAVSESVSSLAIDTNGVSLKVSQLETNTNKALDSVGSSIDTLSKSVSAMITSDDVKIEIQSAMSEGTSKVVTNTGFTFNDEGLTVEKSGSEMKTQITEDGMTVYQNDQAVLVANNSGVDAKNLHATTYLIVGGRSRFENYGTNRTGCFWIGGG